LSVYSFTMNESQLTQLVNEGKSTRDIAEILGKSQGSIRHWLKKFKLKTRFAASAKQKKYSKQELIEAVALSKNYSEVARILGYKVCGGRVNWIKKHILDHQISTDHFESRKERMERMAGISAKTVKEDLYKREELIAINGRLTAGKLRKYLLFNGIGESCACCGLNNWMDKPLRLDVDHINGNPTDNRLINIQFLCPNCHRQKTIPID
jgi:DNA-binding CsgD family transcriptional regulator